MEEGESFSHCVSNDGFAILDFVQYVCTFKISYHTCTDADTVYVG